MATRNRLTDNGYLRAVVMRCVECGGTNFVPRAYVYWDEYEQRWELDDIDDSDIYCNDCEAEVDWSEEPMSREDKLRYTAMRRKREAEEENNGT